MPRANGNVLVLLAAISWSSAGLFTRIVSTDFPTTLFWRSMIGGLCVLAFVYAMKSMDERRRLFHFNIGEIVLALLITAGMVCFISSFYFTTIANVSFMYGLMPLLTFVLSAIFLKDVVSRIGLIACALSMVGAVLVVSGSQDFSDYLGLLLALGMTFFMACLTVTAKYFPDADVTKSTYLSAFLGAVIISPFATFATIPPLDYAWLGLYGFTNVGLGFGLYLLGVTRTCAIAAALVGLVEIPLAPIFAWALFDESIGPFTMLGGTIIVLSTVMYLRGTDHAQ